MRSILYVKEMYDATAIHRTKSETRRTHGLQRVNQWPNRFVILDTFKVDSVFKVTFKDAYSPRSDAPDGFVLRAKWKIGEILYLAEPMWIFTEESVNNFLSAIEIPHRYIYDLSDNQNDEYKKLSQTSAWKKGSPLFMKQAYGRHFIKITDINCERLQDITDEAIVREGISPPSTELKAGTLKTIYSTLFDKVNKPGTWDHNPFVFVYRFDYLPNYKRRLQQCSN